MTLPKFSFEPKITLGNIISIVVFIVAGTSAVIRAEYRLQKVEERQTTIESKVAESTAVSRREFTRELDLAATDRIQLRHEIRELALEVKSELKATRDQEMQHFQALISRIDNLVDK